MNSNNRNLSLRMDNDVVGLFPNKNRLVFVELHVKGTDGLVPGLTVAQIARFLFCI